MRTNKLNKILSSIGIVGIMLYSMTVTSNAALQATSTGTNLTNKTANQFFTLIRGMETEGGTLGLSAELETTTYLDTTKNGIDCHMIKNTEWGTMALLTDSIYGSKVSGQSSTTSTGNNTGVHGIATVGELVTGIWNTSNNNMSTIKTADTRYYNLYSSETSIPGDATIETRLWKGGNVNYSVFVNASNPIFARGGTSLFCYLRCSGTANPGNIYYNGAGSRAVIVVGTGL